MDHKDFNMEDAYKNARIPLPEDAPVDWTNEITGEKFSFEKIVDVGKVLKTFPVALLSSI
jgi:maltooligosyltrehalose synthase